MKATRLFSMIGGLILIVASFLPYGYSIWASGSAFEITIDALGKINNENAMLSLLEQIGSSNTMSAVILVLVIVAFFCFIVGGVIAQVKTGGGSIAGPAGAVLLTIVPIIAGDSSAITSLGIGYWLGWVGAIVCLIGTIGKSRLEGVNLFVNQNVNVQSPEPQKP